MRKRNWPLAPLILGFILGDLFEKYLRQSLSMSSGSLLIFFSRPISLAFIVVTAIVSIIMFRVLKGVPQEVRSEEEKF